MDNLSLWLKEQCSEDPDTILEALKLSPSSLGYIYGALSELLLINYLKENNYEVIRIKEKTSGGNNTKREGYKGDFLIRKQGESDYYVVECKNLKSNSEIRTAKTDSNTHTKQLTTKQAINQLKKYINPNKDTIYQKGLKKYTKAKEKWESDNPGKTFPEFRWSTDNPGPDNVDLSVYFTNTNDLRHFIETADASKLSEANFKKRLGLYSILQTHMPNKRKDPVTGKTSTGPLVSDFSILAVDLFLRTGTHQFVFMTPEEISHQAESPNHLCQNYIIDILIPGKKDELIISPPWYENIDECINNTNPKKVVYDESQLDFR